MQGTMCKSRDGVQGIMRAVAQTRMGVGEGAPRLLGILLSYRPGWEWGGGALWKGEGDGPYHSIQGIPIYAYLCEWPRRCRFEDPLKAFPELRDPPGSWNSSVDPLSLPHSGTPARSYWANPISSACVQGKYPIGLGSFQHNDCFAYAPHSV